MTQAEKDTAVKTLQTEAKDYQAELGFLALQRTQNEKRVADLTVLMIEGERKFRILQDTKLELPTPEIVPT